MFSWPSNPWGDAPVQAARPVAPVTPTGSPVVAQAEGGAGSGDAILVFLVVFAALAAVVGLVVFMIRGLTAPDPAPYLQHPRRREDYHPAADMRRSR